MKLLVADHLLLINTPQKIRKVKLDDQVFDSAALEKQVTVFNCVSLPQTLQAALGRRSLLQFNHHAAICMIITTIAHIKRFLIRCFFFSFQVLSFPPTSVHASWILHDSAIPGSPLQRFRAAQRFLSLGLSPPATFTRWLQSASDKRSSLVISPACLGSVV